MEFILPSTYKTPEELINHWERREEMLQQFSIAHFPPPQHFTISIYDQSTSTKIKNHGKSLLRNLRKQISFPNS
jgi:hypothetical protein